jgi:hypothetical protein
MNGKKNFECNQRAYAFVKAAVHAMSVKIQILTPGQIRDVVKEVRMYELVWLL